MYRLPGTVVAALLPFDFSPHARTTASLKGLKRVLATSDTSPLDDRLATKHEPGHRLRLLERLIEEENLRSCDMAGDGG
jgi:hypothetical protein